MGGVARIIIDRIDGVIPGIPDPQDDAGSAWVYIGDLLLHTVGGRYRLLYADQLDDVSDDRYDGMSVSHGVYLSEI